MANIWFLVTNLFLKYAFQLVGLSVLLPNIASVLQLLCVVLALCYHSLGTAFEHGLVDQPSTMAVSALARLVQGQ